MFAAEIKRIFHGKNDAKIFEKHDNNLFVTSNVTSQSRKYIFVQIVCVYA